MQKLGTLLFTTAMLGLMTPVIFGMFLVRTLHMPTTAMAMGAETAVETVAAMAVRKSRAKRAATLLRHADRLAGKLLGKARARRPRWRRSSNL